MNSQVSEPGQKVLRYLAALRAAGVAEFEGDDSEGCRIRVRFHPPTVVLEPAELPRDFGTPACCACGHEKDTEHNPHGLCYMGCPVSLCHPTPTAKPGSDAVTG